MKKLQILVLFALIGSFAFQAEAKKVKLAYRFNQGDQLKYEISVAQDIAQEMMGQTNSMTNSTMSLYELKVTGVDASGNYRFEGKMVELSINSSNPMTEVKYNSATDKEVPEAAKINAMTLNQTYSFTLSGRGEITDVQAPEGLVDRIQKELDNLQGAMGVVSAAQNPGSSEAFAKTMGQLFIKLPAEDVKTKSTWEDEEKYEQMVVFNTKTTSTLIKAGEETNDLEIKTQITQADASAGMEVQGMNITYQLSGTGAGTMNLDAKSGAQVTSTMVTTISGAINVEGAQLPEPMSIPMAIKSTEKITRK
jgi:hypothetical protein